MKVEVAIGEIFDKITILDIKLERITDQSRLDFVRTERVALADALFQEGVVMQDELYEELKSINTKIWDTEAGFREKEAKKEFDEAENALNTLKKHGFEQTTIIQNTNVSDSVIMGDFNIDSSKE